METQGLGPRAASTPTPPHPAARWAESLGETQAAVHSAAHRDSPPGASRGCGFIKNTWRWKLFESKFSNPPRSLTTIFALLKTIFFLCHCSVAQLGPTLCNRTDCSTPRFPLCLIFNIFVESVVMLLLFCFGFLATRHVGSSPPTVDSTHSPALGGKVFTTGPPGKPP